jgi:acetylglutamate kinase
MRTVIKLAGALLEDDAVVCSLARQIASIAKEGPEILVVHGGGRLFTATLKRLGIESKFVSGLRVTDRETRDVAVMVFAGLLNKRLSAAISAEGQPAIGISAADAKCFRAEPMFHNAEEGDLGFVGYLTSVNVAVLESLWREGLLPVAACLGLGADNELYNINADHMAAACAEYLAADQLIYLTDVAGVLDGEKVLSAIACEEIERLVQSRVVSGGMVLKLEAAKRALEGGVREVRIVGGSSPDALLLASRAAENSAAEDSADVIPGTRVVREPLASARTAVSVA